MSLYVLIMLGGQAVGGPLMGTVVEHFGAHTGMVLSGLVPAAAAIVLGVLLFRRGGLTLASACTRTRGS